MATMTDRELLELAAKAAGKSIDWRDTFDAQNQEYLTLSYGWNPLTDDGDALRLAVKLDIGIVKSNDLESTDERLWCTVEAENQEGFKAVEHELDDSYAATRRAIVRAAAEIGKSMKEGHA